MQSTLKEFQDKRRFRQMLYSKTSAAVLLVLFFFVAKATWGVYEKSGESEEKKQQVVTEVAVLRDREAKLSDHINRLQTEDGIETEIRENYRMAKPGEQLVVIVDESVPAEAAVIGPWGRMWEAIMGLFE